MAKIHPLRKARKSRSMTLTELGDLVLVDSGNLSRIERFQQRVSPDLAEKIAAVFAGELTEMHLLYPERYVVKERPNANAS
ncbi:MAG: helix-turn-helix transcriptional regulator [Moraxellaceae bacterium]